MTAREKLNRLIDDRNRANVARRCGLKASTMHAICHRGVEPRVGNAIKIARELKVPVEWLFDDTADWPPPSADTNGPSPIAHLSTAEKINRLLAERGWSQSELARRVGCSAAAISRGLKDGAEFGSLLAFRVARELNVELEWLLDDQQGWPPIHSQDRGFDDDNIVNVVRLIVGALKRAK